MSGCFYLADALEAGRGIPQNYERAARNYRVSCDGRNGEACARLAALYDKGAGVDRMPERAAAMRRRACELGHAESCPKAKGAT